MFETSDALTGDFDFRFTRQRIRSITGYTLDVIDELSYGDIVEILAFESGKAKALNKKNKQKK